MRFDGFDGLYTLDRFPSLSILSSEGFQTGKEGLITVVYSVLLSNIEKIVDSIQDRVI